MMGDWKGLRPTEIIVKVSSLAEVEKTLREVKRIGRTGSYDINVIVEADLRKKLFFHS